MCDEQAVESSAEAPGPGASRIGSAGSHERRAHKNLLLTLLVACAKMLDQSPKRLTRKPFAPRPPSLLEPLFAHHNYCTSY